MESLDQHDRWAIRRHSSLLRSLGVRNPIIFEVGANDGRAAESYFAELPEAHVFAFEPNPDVVGDWSRFGDEKFRGIQVALGGSLGSKVFHRRRDSRVSGFLDVDPELSARSRHYDIEESTEVDMVTIDHLLSDGDLPTPDLLRIMTRGFDLEVLRGAENTLARVMVPIVACEIYFATAFVGQPRPHEVLSFLEQYGYRLYGFDRLVETTSGTLYFGTGLFLSPSAWTQLGLL